MSLITNIGDCECLNADGTWIPNCVTTVFVATVPVACVGVVTIKPVAALTYDCAPITIPKIEYNICTDCKCAFKNVLIKSLPLDGTLTLKGVPVAVNQSITEKDNGQLVLQKTAAFVGTNTFTVAVRTTCGDSADLVLTINYSNKDCTPVPCVNC